MEAWLFNLRKDLWLSHVSTLMPAVVALWKPGITGNWNEAASKSRKLNLKCSLELIALVERL